MRHPSLKAVVLFLTGWTVVALVGFMAGNAAAAVSRKTYDVIIEQVFGYDSPSLAPAKVAASASSARTATDLPTKYEMIELTCDQNAHWKLGDSTVAATTSDHPLPAWQPMVYNAGGNARVAFILDAAAAGNCWVYPMR